MMASARKLLAAYLCACLLLSTALSLTLLVHHHSSRGYQSFRGSQTAQSQHKCAGENCEVCACLEHGRSILKLLGALLLAAALAPPTRKLCGLFATGAFVPVSPVTPVRLHDRIDR